MKTSIKTIMAGTLVFAAFFGASSLAYANHEGTPDLWDVFDHIVCGSDGCVSGDVEEDDGLYWRGGDPVIQTLGATTISRSSVVLQAHYDSAGADYNSTDLPRVYVRYGEDHDMDHITQAAAQNQGSRVVSFQIANLASDTHYYYQAVLLYRGGHVSYGDRLSFSTLRSNQVPIVDCIYDDQHDLGEGVSNFVTGSNQNGCTPHGTVVSPYPSSSGSGTSTNQSSSSSNSSSQSSNTSSSSNSQTTANTTSSSGSRNQVAGISQTSNEGVITGSSGNVSLRITNSESEFKQGDRVTFRVTVSNTGTTSARSGRLIVTLPSEFEFIKSSDGTFDEKDHELTARLSTLPGGESRSLTFSARVSDLKDDDSVITRAVLTFTKSSTAYTVRASDTDDLEALSGNVLGASVFGAGFFPQTLAGWVVLIIIITALIFVIRRYSKGVTGNV